MRRLAEPRLPVGAALKWTFFHSSESVTNGSKIGLHNFDMKMSHMRRESDIGYGTCANICRYTV